MAAVEPRGTTTDVRAAAALRARNAAAGIPQPSAAQLVALNHSLVMFMHFSMCTYTGCQWNLATSPAQDFAPPDAGPNATQWAETALALGATQICLTVRHVGGFALWPTATTNYSVAASAWRGGRGDVAADFVAAVRAVGISPCFYIILGFDVHANHTGVPGPIYLEHQVMALTELLTNYGPVARFWWDNYGIGCCQPVTHEGLYCPGGGTKSTPSAACPGWQLLIDTVRALSPTTAIVPGPDGCLVNGEVFGGTYPLYHASSFAQASYTCNDASTPNAGPYFSVVESDFSSSSQWFWLPDDPYLNASVINDQLTLKLEQGANVILNAPPNSTGVVEDALVAQLARVGAARAATYAAPRGALPAPAAAVCADLSATIAVAGDFDTVLLREDLVGGQVIDAYSLEVRDAASGAWRALVDGVHGRTVGLRVRDAVGLQRGVDALRFNCSRALAPPAPSGSGAVSFVNAQGQCMGIAANATFPCYTGGEGPFSLCPLVAADCAGAGAAWTPGLAGPMSLTALGVAQDAVVNVDCDQCAAGTHAKLIKNSGCNCASALEYDAALGALRVAACPGMCLSNGIAAGAHASCAGVERACALYCARAGSPCLCRCPHPHPPVPPLTRHLSARPPSRRSVAADASAP